LAQHAVYCIIKLRWALPDILSGILAVPQSLMPDYLENPGVLKAYRAFVTTSIAWWSEQEKKALDEAKKGVS
jgi:hypothetical protein